MGEEHEQVFSRMYQYGNCTKHMTPASMEANIAINFFFHHNCQIISDRNDHITMGIFYWNRQKFDKMARELPKRLNRVSSSLCYF